MLIKTKFPAAFVSFTKPNVSLDAYKTVYINPFLVQAVNRSGQPDQPAQSSVILFSGSAFDVLGSPEEVVAKLRLADE